MPAKRKELYFGLLTALVICIIYLLGMESFTAGFTSDSGDYVSVAKNFSDRAILDRPIGYPLLLWIIMGLCGNLWQQALVIVQVLMMGCSGFLCYNVLRRTRCNIFFSVLVAAFAICTPSLIRSAQVVMTESSHAFFTILLWYTLLNYMDDKKEKISIISPVIIGLISSYCALIKPVWLPGIIPVAVLCYFILKRQNRKFILKHVMIICAVHFLIIGSWQLHVYNKYHSLSLSRVGNVNFNLAAIRAGLTKYGEGTHLYNYLDSVGELPKALSLTWSNQRGFDEIKNTLVWEIRSDKAFSKKIQQQAWQPFIACQLKRYQYFYTTRENAEKLFPSLPSFFSHIYSSIYAVLFRPFMPILLLCSLLLIRRKEFLTMQLLSFTLIFYYWALLTALTYYDAHFGRMRTSVDSIMIITALLPILYLFNYFKVKSGAATKANS